MADPKDGWGFVEWGFTAGIPVFMIGTSYLALKFRAMWQKDISECKDATMLEVKNIVDGVGKRLDENIDRDNIHEKDNRADFKEVHKRINDNQKEADTEFKSLENKIQTGHETIMTILNDIKVSVGVLESQNKKGS